MPTGRWDGAAFPDRENGIHTSPRCAHAQSQERQPRSPAQPADRHHRACPARAKSSLGFRHALRRRAAALRRIAVGVRAAIPAADGEARRRPDRRSVAGDLDRAEGDQSHNPRSTVGTVTEIHDYLRLLYARVGDPYCPNHPEIRSSTRMTISQMVDATLASAAPTRG